MTKETRTFVQRVIEEAKQEALGGVIEGSLSLLRGVGVDHSIGPQAIQAAQENLREAVAFSFNLTNPSEIEEKVRKLKRHAHNKWQDRL